MAVTLFMVISILGVLTALGTILARNLVHAALFLVAFFFVVACQFVLLEAEFLAALQVLIYIGAVAILMMFGIMLTRNIQGDDTTSVGRAWTLPALIGGLGLFLVLAFGINQAGVHQRIEWKRQTSRPAVPQVIPGQPPPTRAAAINNMGRTVGDEMMTRFVVPFELAGLLLTAALVGAIALAYREGDDAESPRRGTTKPVWARGTPPSGNGHSSPESAPTEANAAPTS